MRFRIGKSTTITCKYIEQKSSIHPFRCVERTSSSSMREHWIANLQVQHSHWHKWWKRQAFPLICVQYWTCSSPPEQHWNYILQWFKHSTCWNTHTSQVQVSLHHMKWTCFLSRETLEKFSAQCTAYRACHCSAKATWNASQVTPSKASFLPKMSTSSLKSSKCMVMTSKKGASSTNKRKAKGHHDGKCWLLYPV